MAIERQAQNVDFGSAPQAGAVPTAVGYVSPQPERYLDASRANAPQNGLLDNLVSAVLPAVNKLGQQELQNGREEAYLRGQAAAGAGLAQDQVDSNILTKDWATAGYRDTRGRLAQADAEAQTAVDMQKLREQSPADFQQYLNDRRTKLLPSLEGMSLDARKGFMAQQLTSDRAAIAKHAGEHQKFIIDQLGTAVQTDMSVRFDAMTKARTDPAAYLTATDDAFAGMYNNVWTNPNLPKDVKVKMTGEAATLALAQNHQLLYEKMRDTKMPGMQGSLLDSLPFDDQVKLAAAYKTSLADTAAFRLNDYNTQRGLMEASFDDPLKPAVSWDDFNAFMQNGIQMKAISAGDISGMTKSWAEGNQKKLATGRLAASYATGDVQGMFGLGKNEGDGYTAYIQAAARNGKSVADTVGSLLQIGQSTGQQSAFKGVGDLTRSAVSMIGTGQTIDPNQLQMLNTVLSTLDTAQTKGNATAMSSYLSSFSDDDRAKIMTYREGLQSGKNPTQAATDAADILAKTSQLSPTERNVLAVQHATGDQAIINDITPKGLWGTVKDKIPEGIRTLGGLLPNGSNASKIAPGQSWFENSERVDTALAQSRTAVAEELNYISRSNPYASDDTRKRLALAKVAERTLVLPDGPLVIPRLPSGATMQSYFGVNQNIRPETIADAIGEMHVAGKGNRVVYKINGQSQLQWQEYGKHGELVNPGGTLDPKEVAGAVQARQDKITEKFMATDGAGVTLKGSDGTPVQFNGNNTAAIQNSDMLDFRKNLVKYESVTNKPYDDLSGKVVNGKVVQTVGVGVSSHNPHFPPVEADGTVTQANINNSFIRASNDAAVAARGGQERLGLPGASAFKLLAELSYQGGGAFYNVDANKPYVQALKDHNLDRALTALKDTSQYKVSGADRRQHYEDMTRKALGGLATPTQTATQQQPNPFQ